MGVCATNVCGPGVTTGPLGWPHWTAIADQMDEDAETKGERGYAPRRAYETYERFLSNARRHAENQAAR